mmetsp:Transcript_22393/g.63549  ORF Transcript_22393/g.63549 Transcript_22393/m.63549 type:complete len:251 (-) Transcript_22393:15-767(-)
MLSSLILPHMLGFPGFFFLLMPSSCSLLRCWWTTAREALKMFKATGSRSGSFSLRPSERYKLTTESIESRRARMVAVSLPRRSPWFLSCALYIWRMSATCLWLVVTLVCCLAPESRAASACMVLMSTATSGLGVFRTSSSLLRKVLRGMRRTFNISRWFRHRMQKQQMHTPTTHPPEMLTKMMCDLTNCSRSLGTASSTGSVVVVGRLVVLKTVVVDASVVAGGGGAGAGWGTGRSEGGPKAMNWRSASP